MNPDTPIERELLAACVQAYLCLLETVDVQRKPVRKTDDTIADYFFRHGDDPGYCRDVRRMHGTQHALLSAIFDADPRTARDLVQAEALHDYIETDADALTYDIFVSELCERLGIDRDNTVNRKPEQVVTGYQFEPNVDGGLDN